MTAIERVAVIGAGVMGSGIAAQVANAGKEVLLLDIVPKGADNRNAIAEGAIARMLKTDPAPFMHKQNAKRITPGNTEDHLDRLAECDWIIEAVIEKLDIKQDLYRRIEKVRKLGAIVSSNTSTIPLSVLTRDMPESFRRDFLITHFFNPPRYMRLLEVVAGKETRAEAVSAMRAFADIALGKSVVDCRDTPGFIANRIGTFWLQCSVVEAMDGGLAIEEADAVVGPPMGFPKTGVFGLLDLVGLDLMPHVLNGLADALPKEDAFQAIYRKPEMIERMIAQGYTGRKGKGGFYRIDKASGKKVKQAMDLQSGEYRRAAKPKFTSVKTARKQGLRAVVEHPDKGGRYAWRVLSQTLSYAASLVPEIADDIAAIDEAMRLGYNWKQGPFEMLDRLGPAWFSGRLAAEGLPVPPFLAKAGRRSFYRVENGRRQRLALDGTYRDMVRPAGVVMLSDIKLSSKQIVAKRSASLWDIGDGVACLEFHSKMNSLNLGILAMVRKVAALVPGRYKALVVYNEGSNFSVGANLALLLVPAMLRLAPLIGWMVGRGQRAFKALKYAPFPVVGAPSGMALGGGCEALLHCDTIQAHAETYMGLVEPAVGLIPGWGGCKEMLTRWWVKPHRPGGPMPPVAKVFETVSTATVAKSAAEAKAYLFLRPEDGITMNRYRLLADAKAKALALVAGYRPPLSVALALPGPSARAAMELAVHDFRRRGLATAYDTVVAGALAGVLSGGATDVTETLGEDDLLTLERRAFTRLACRSGTVARIVHMLKTGKPLRN